MFHQPFYGRRDFLRVGGWTLGAGALGLGFSSRSFAAGTHIKVLNSAGLQSNIMEAMIKNLGYGDQFGLDLEYVNVADGSKIIGGLIGGVGDMCSWSGFPQVLPAIEKGGNLKIVGGSLITPVLAIYSAKPEIQNLQDLEGKTVAAGAYGSLLYMGTVAVLRKYKVDETKVKFVSIGSSQDTFRALVAGTVDAGLAEVEVQGELHKFGIHNVKNGELWDELSNFTWQAAYASEDAIAKKRDILVRMLAVNAKLFRFLQSPNSWDEWEKAFRSQSGASYDRVAAKTFWDFIQKRKPFAVDLVLSEARFRYVQQLNISLGVQKIELPYAKIADMSLAHDALKLLS